MTNPLRNVFLSTAGFYKIVHPQVYHNGVDCPTVLVTDVVETPVMDQVQWQVRMLLWYHSLDWTQVDATRRVTSGSATRLDHITAA